MKMIRYSVLPMLVPFLAEAAYADRWRRFRKRLSDLNGLFARKMAQRQRR